MGLTTSPKRSADTRLIERYLGAADKESAPGYGRPADIGRQRDDSRARRQPSARTHRRIAVRYPRWAAHRIRTLPLDAEYEISATLYRTNNGFTRGLQFPHEVEFNVDGKRVFATTVGGAEDWGKLLANPADAGAFDTRLRAKVEDSRRPASHRRGRVAKMAAAARRSAAAVLGSLGSGGLRRRSANRHGDESRGRSAPPGAGR